MSQHIFKTIRQFVLSAAFKALPMRSARLEEPEPLRNSVNPDTDAWLLEPSPSIAEQSQDMVRNIGCLADTLSGLHSIISLVSASAPSYRTEDTNAGFGTIWSDDVLFDGEPFQVPSAESDVSGDDLLFDDKPYMPVPAAFADIELRASL